MKEKLADTDYVRIEKAVSIIRDFLSGQYPELDTLKVKVTSQIDIQSETDCIQIPWDFEYYNFGGILRLITAEMLFKVYQLRKISENESEILSITNQVVLHALESGVCLTCGTFIGNSEICFFCGRVKNFHCCIN